MASAQHGRDGAEDLLSTELVTWHVSPLDSVGIEADQAVGAQIVLLQLGGSFGGVLGRNDVEVDASFVFNFQLAHGGYDLDAEGSRVGNRVIADHR